MITLDDTSVASGLCLFRHLLGCASFHRIATLQGRTQPHFGRTPPSTGFGAGSPWSPGEIPPLPATREALGSKMLAAAAQQVAAAPNFSKAPLLWRARGEGAASDSPPCPSAERVGRTLNLPAISPSTRYTTLAVIRRRGSPS